VAVVCIAAEYTATHPMDAGKRAQVWGGGRRGRVEREGSSSPETSSFQWRCGPVARR